MRRQVFVLMKELSKVFRYRDVPVLTYDIHYPQFVSPARSLPLDRINARYRHRAVAFAQYARDTLYPQAAADLAARRSEEYPFNPYEARMDSTITQLEDCLLSLYTDQYTFTGGAHGNTVRIADTFDLRSGQELPLAALYPGGQVNTTAILAQIRAQIAQTPDIYYDLSENAVEETFHPSQFYLTPQGVTFFFQQYDIAPYATGIPTFSFPYEEIGAVRPTCGWH